MNILYGKIGKSILFNKEKWGTVGGDQAPSALLIKIAEMNPNNNYYILGKSDFTRCKNKGMIFPNNIIDLYDKYDSKVFGNELAYILPRINKENVKFDAGIFFVGMASSINLPNFKLRNDSSEEYVKTLGFATHYVAPILKVLNELMVPYFTLTEDPRAIPLKALDRINVEKFSLSQMTSYIKQSLMKGRGRGDDSNRVEVNIKYIYSRIETIFLLDEKKYIWDISKNEFFNRKGFRMWCHWSESREQLVKNLFLSNNIPVEIYGKNWGEAYNSFPNIFKDIAMKDMKDIILQTRYTLLPAMLNQYKNFCTQKFWEVINLGIIPFAQKDTYDCDRLLPLPEFCRFKDANELSEKINLLDNDIVLYNNLRERLHNELKDDYFNGKFLNDLINAAILEVVK